MQKDLFGSLDLGPPPEPVLMSLNPEYYDLIWRGLKRHEFRRRYLTARPTTWYVYLTVPVSRLSAVINLDAAIAADPQRIAEQTQAGSGTSVYKYLQDLDRGFALPIKQVSEYPGFSIAELTDMLGSFHPPQGYILLARHPALAAACEKFATGEPVRKMTVQRATIVDETEK